jgi:hypothetical protein
MFFYMGIHIIVYVDKPPTNKQVNIVKAIQTTFPVLVDAIHQNDLEYLQKNFTNARFFFLSEFISMCTPEELADVSPDFVISFNDDFEVTDKQWVSISRYFENLILPEATHPELIVGAAQELLHQFISPAPITLPPEIPPTDTKEHYEIYTHHVQDRDIMLIQVEKPFCDLPYTVVIRDFSNKGLTSFFTDLFICDSWGVSRKDYEFLQQLWLHWKMEGEYNLDKMLHEATKRCFPQENQQPEAEPEVYRRPIENVLETFRKREEGAVVKERDLWNQKRLEKRKLEEDLLIN